MTFGSETSQQQNRQPRGSAPGRFRLRSDLEISSQVYAGDECIVVKDPVSLSYFRFEPDEYRVLQLITNVTLDELSTAINEQLNESPDNESLRQFVLRLVSSGLVLTAESGESQRILHQKQMLDSANKFAWARSLLYIKFPGFDPEPVLGWIYPKVRLLFSKTVFVLGLMLIAFVAMYSVVHADEMSVRLQEASMRSMLSWSTLFWLWIALGVSKVLHEFGHGLTCRHFGGECHEMGGLLLVFSPCLYCDASDAWTMPQKWHRIAVSAAGIYVELLIASVSAIVWWSTSDGTVHNIALVLMVLCSLTTVLVNANPLLRFDGYYILSDLLEIPNLQIRARATIQSVFDKHLLGITNAESPQMPVRRRAMFLLYAVASWLYRWLLCAGILWFFYKVLTPYRLGSVSLVFASVVSIQLLGRPIWMTAKRVYQAMSHRSLRYGRFTFTCVVAGLIGWFVVSVPVPVYVTAPLTVQVADQRSVVIPVTGRLEKIGVTAGRLVDESTVLATLSNASLDDQIAQLEHRIRLLKITAARQSALQQMADESLTQSLQKSLNEQLETRKAEKEKLTIVAPLAGRIVCAEEMIRPEDSLQSVRGLSWWTGNPLMKSNLGAQLAEGTTLCEIVPDSSPEVTIIVGQSDVSLLKPQQSVRVQLDAAPTHVMRGQIIDISRIEAASVPRQLLTDSGGDVRLQHSNNSGPSLSGVYYQIRASLDDNSLLPGAICSGYRGRARIRCDSATCWNTVVRQLNRMFAL